MTRTFLVSGLVAGLAATTAPAMAQGQSACTQSHDITKLLSDDFSELPVAFGVQRDGSLMQIYASKQGNTWTVVLTKPEGVSCIVAEGVRWEALPREPEGPLA
jgi:hypothetical protein